MYFAQELLIANILQFKHTDDSICNKGNTKVSRVVEKECINFGKEIETAMDDIEQVKVTT